jgi:hypothetical protein
MDAWVKERGVILIGVDLDESRWLIGGCLKSSRSIPAQSKSRIRCARSLWPWPESQ